MKNKIIQLFPRNDIPVEVYDWYLRLEEGGLSSVDYCEFEIWAKKNPDQAAYLPEVEKAWRQISKAKLDVPVDMKSIPTIKASGAKASLLPSYLSAGLVGAFVLAMAALILPFWGSQGLPAFETVDEQRHFVTLSDGTTVQLNALTKITIDYKPEQRIVNLEHGEAYFSVAKDPGRPFIVVSKEANVRAIGTAFNVKQVKDQHSAVTLVEGVVEVSRVIDETINASTTLSEKGNQAILYSPVGVKSIDTDFVKVGAGIELSDVDVDEVISWKEDKIIFSGEPLNSAIVKLNVYSSHQIELSESSIGLEPIFGVFKMGDWKSAVRAIESTYPLKAKRVGTNQTLLVATNE